MHITSSETYQVAVSNPGAFIGGTTNGRGDHDGTQDPTTLFTVTGDVAVRIYGCATVAPVGASATIEVGVTGGTAELIAQSTATDLAIGDVWTDATPTTKTSPMTDLAEKLIPNGQDIIETIGTANITAGNIYYVCMWRPITPGSTVVGVSA